MSNSNKMIADATLELSKLSDEELNKIIELKDKTLAEANEVIEKQFGQFLPKSIMRDYDKMQFEKIKMDAMKNNKNIVTVLIMADIAESILASRSN